MKAYRHRPIEELRAEALADMTREARTEAAKTLKRGRLGRILGQLRGKPPIKEFIVDPHTLGLRLRRRWE